MLLFRYVDHLPAVPMHLIDQTRQLIREAPVDHAVPARTVTVGNLIHHNVEYNRYRACEELTEWIHNNITKNYVSMGVQIQNPGDDNHTHFPHTDTAPRHWVLNYNIQPGGDKVITHWYQQHGYTLIREGTTRPSNLDDLEIVDSVQIQPFRWHLLNTSVLHGVTNIQHPRIAITMGFATNPLETML